MVSMVLAVGAVLRLSRLAGTDVITQPLRDHLRGWVLKMVTCGWCNSIWIAALIVMPSWWLWGDTHVWKAVALGLIASWFAGVTYAWGNGKPTAVDVGAIAPVTVFIDDVPDLDDLDNDEAS